MTLDEAIKHCEEIASAPHCDKDCANEHRQLAEWLKELKAYREQGKPKLKLTGEKRGYALKTDTDCPWK